MKTMLKIKDLKNQFYGHGLLILSVPQFGTLNGYEVNVNPVVINTIITQHKSESNASGKDTLYVPLVAQDSTLAPDVNDCIDLEAPKITLNSKGKKYVADFIKKNDEDLALIKKRSPNSLRIIENIFQKNNMPTELKYLAVIESELKTNAVSKVGAVGPWQFMSQTAKYLGLKVTSKYDERKHLTRSTQAAAKYLKILHNQFDDWLLVIAAYNSGAGPVYNAIKRSGSRDFWKLQYFLPAETRNHVKRFIGAHYFFENNGSIITLTKAERNKYLKEMDAYQAQVKKLEELKTVAFNSAASKEVSIKGSTTEDIETFKEK
jgi:membrane-bound lytic murein transglycosylase D